MTAGDDVGRVTLPYDSALGEVAGRFMEGLRQRKILVTDFYYVLAEG